MHSGKRFYRLHLIAFALVSRVFGAALRLRMSSTVDSPRDALRLDGKDAGIEVDDVRAFANFNCDFNRCRRRTPPKAIRFMSLPLTLVIDGLVNTNLLNRKRLAREAYPVATIRKPGAVRLPGRFGSRRRRCRCGLLWPTLHPRNIRYRRWGPPKYLPPSRSRAENRHKRP